MADISTVSNVTSNISELLKNSASSNSTDSVSLGDDSFSSLLSSAMNMIDETNTLTNSSELSALNFALGNADNSHDLTIAQQKAALSLQYTVAVKNKFLEAYREIMNIQI